MGLITEEVDGAFADFIIDKDMFNLIERLASYADYNIRSEKNMGIFLSRIEHWKQKLTVAIEVTAAT